MRRAFDLSPEDVRALEAIGRPWEAVKSAGSRFLLIHGHPVPSGYNHASVEVAIKLDVYPPGPLDMAYVYPVLAREDGKTINNLAMLEIDGRAFQQWSRHYGFRSGVDTLSSHLRRFRSWLTHEFRKR
ncbi:E2/UBC family protein [Phenylobacterium sp.]|uniref:E2/UBC family protein n=1 Tax=Phenylobacterium sp. TaxID=1871053 RepID=UPI0025FADAF0|nr:E2/UBC family protein [Phenylobacterium sp.]